MSIPPPGSFQDRQASEGLEQIGSVKDKERKMSSSPLIFPNNIGSPGGFNNHFMIIDIMSESAGLGDAAGDLLKKLKDGGNPTKRTLLQAEQSIVLYMPNTLAFTTQNDYEEVSLTSIGLDLLPGPMGTIIDKGAKILNRPLNPRTEILFSNTKVRQFQFDFLFAPSSEQETNTLKQIIFEMRRAAAVKRQDFGLKGMLWIPPRKLQIRFYHTINGIAKESEAFPQLKLLVIENLDFDFAPAGTYSTFTNGYPVSTRMMLRVKEEEVIDREWIENNDRGTPRGTERF